MSPASCSLSPHDRDIRWDNEVRGPRTRKRGRRSGPSYPSMFGGLRRYVEDYLAHPPAFLHEVEGRGGLFEREGLVDHRAQAVLGEEVEHRAEHDYPYARLRERDEGVEILAADVVDREVHAPGHALELPAPVLGVVVYTPLRAELLRLLDLLVAPRGEDRKSTRL